MNLKLHLAAISIIVLLLVAVYIFSNRGTGEGNTPIALEVVNASYGLNCLAQQPAQGSEPNAIYKDESTPAVRKNNVLVAVSRLCNGQPTCQFEVNESNLGSNPNPTCYKELEVDYRCFSYDRLRSAETAENNIISLSCPAQVQ